MVQYNLSLGNGNRRDVVVQYSVAVMGHTHHPISALSRALCRGGGSACVGFRTDRHAWTVAPSGAAYGAFGRRGSAEIPEGCRVCISGNCRSR